MARTTFVEGRTQLVICDIVTPARILMRSFPSNAAVSPSSLSIECANCGLQLSAKKGGEEETDCQHSPTTMPNDDRSAP